MESYSYSHPVYGKTIAIPQPYGNEWDMMPVQLFQNDSTEYTSRGIVWIRPSSLDDTAPINFSKLAYVSADIWEKDRESKRHKPPVSSFPIQLEVKEYSTDHLKVFIRVWQQSNHFGQVGKMLGISDKKVQQIAKRLRQAGVKLPEKQDELKDRPKQTFDWKKFVRLVRSCKYIETGLNATGFTLSKFLFLCISAQKQGVKLTIPPFENQPEWINVRSKNQLKQSISINSKHGSGKNFKIKWAGYKRQPARIDNRSLRSLLTP